jgi:hypothetical protein
MQGDSSESVPMGGLAERTAQWARSRAGVPEPKQPRPHTGGSLERGEVIYKTVPKRKRNKAGRVRSR